MPDAVHFAPPAVKHGEAKCTATFCTVAGMREPFERLVWARKRRKIETATAAAERFQWNVNTYRSHENGSRDLSRKAAERYGKAFRVPVGWLLTGEGTPDAGAPSSITRGYVGAGAEIVPADGDSAALDEVELPPGAPAGVVPVRVRGDSMYPRYFDGEHLFYGPEQQPPAELVNKECVVRLADGRMFVKIIKRGSRRNVFNLDSWNGSTIEDVRIEWAAPVRWRG